MDTIEKLIKHGFREFDNNKFELKLENKQEYKYRGQTRVRNLWSLTIVTVDDFGMIKGFTSSSYEASKYYSRCTFEELINGKG